MGDTGIEWASKVWNPVTGCTPVSAGCANCYARRMAHRLRGRGGYPADDPFRVTLHENRLSEPLHWRKPQTVFVCSMGDLFHEDVPAEYIDRVLAVIEECKQHTFIVLTKRPENIDSKMYGGSPFRLLGLLGGGDCLPNLWLGVSVEDQPSADERVSRLLKIYAAKRIISYEPALGPVDWSAYFGGQYVGLLGDKVHDGYNFGIDWLIVGGETGPGSRACDERWIESAVKQATAAGVPVFIKQLGRHYYHTSPGGQLSHLSPADQRGKDPGEWAEHLRVREWPNSRTGD